MIDLNKIKPSKKYNNLYIYGYDYMMNPMTETLKLYYRLIVKGFDKLGNHIKKSYRVDNEMIKHDYFIGKLKIDGFDKIISTKQKAWKSRKFGSTYISKEKFSYVDSIIIESLPSRHDCRAANSDYNPLYREEK